MSTIKKSFKKMKLASDKTWKKQFNLYFIRKDMGKGLNATG